MSAHLGSRSKCQHTAAPDNADRRSITGSISAPRRLYCPVARARNPSMKSPKVIQR
jgi:hypothetical protein